MFKTNQLLISSLLIMLNLIISPLFGNQNNIGDKMQTSHVINGPGSFKILNNCQYPIRIPFTMHKGKPLMELEINGNKAFLMIDNGVLWDEVWLFGSPLIDQLSIKTQGSGEIGGAGEGDPTQAFIAQNMTLTFDNIEFYEQPMVISPKTAGFADMFPGTDGQLCNTFFKHFIVEFDFIKQEIILHDPNQFEFTKDGSVLDMKEEETKTHSVPFSFTMLDGKTYTDRIDIDLGGVYPIKIALNNDKNIKMPTDVKPTRSFGAQGQDSEFSGQIKSMTFGKYTFNNPTAIFGDEKTSRIHPGNLGVIGLPLFMKFNIIFDYFNNRMYIYPNELFGKPF